MSVFELDPRDVTVHIFPSALRPALTLLETSGLSGKRARILLYCADGELIFRQGQYETRITCEGQFRGAYSISKSSLGKWCRAQYVGGSAARFLVRTIREQEEKSIRLQFVNQHLNVGAISLPVKWDVEVGPLQFPLPFPQTQITIKEKTAKKNEEPASPPGETARLATESHTSKTEQLKGTCIDFTLNVSTQELIDAFKKCALSIPQNDLQIRTWQGELIFTRGNIEHRIECEGYVRGFAVFRAADVSRLAVLRSDNSRFITLASIKGKLRFLGETFQLKWRAVLQERPQTDVESIDVQAVTVSPEESKNSRPLSSADNGTRREMTEPRDHQDSSLKESHIATQSSLSSLPDTSLTAILRYADTATEQQIAEMGMLEIVAAAIVTRDRLIHQAAELLKPLEISEEVLQSLLVRSIQERQAKTKIE